EDEALFALIAVDGAVADRVIKLSTFAVKGGDRRVTVIRDEPRAPQLCLDHVRYADMVIVLIRVQVEPFGAGIVRRIAVDQRVTRQLVHMLLQEYFSVQIRYRDSSPVCS